MKSVRQTRLRLFNVACLFILGMMTISGCSKATDDFKTSVKTRVMIRGIECRTPDGVHFYTLGNPDIRLRYPENNSDPMELALVCYPNPANNNFYLYIGSESSIQQARVWLVPAVFTDPTPDMVLFPGNSIISPVSTSLPDTVLTLKNSSVHLKFAGLQSGFYRLYLKSGKLLLWDNIMIYN
jgi:hypothetical protein